VFVAEEGEKLSPEEPRCLLPHSCFTKEPFGWLWAVELLC
jgi:hypothetical protein